MLGEQIDDLALALVTPLRADDDCRRHDESVCQKPQPSPWSIRGVPIESGAPASLDKDREPTPSGLEFAAAVTSAVLRGSSYASARSANFA